MTRKDDGPAAGSDAGAGGLPVSKIQPAYRQVAEQLKTLILRGELRPGERLPNEADAATMFGVSRGTMREALRELASQNLVITTRGVNGGTAIAFPAPEYVMEFLESSFSLMSGAQTVTVEQFLEVREQLEVPAARLAAQRRTDEQLADLRSVVANASDAAQRSTLEHGADPFHTMLLDATGNPLLSVVTRPIFGVLRTRFLPESAPDGFWRQVVHDHEEILALVEAGDGDGAARAMKGHLSRLRPVYRQDA